MDQPDHERMIRLLRANRLRLLQIDEAPLEQPVRYYPSTWASRLSKLPQAQLLLEREGDPHNGRSAALIDRSELVDLAAGALNGADDEILALFVACQIWGSGTKNGRGPRHTADAIRDPARAVAVLTTTRDLVRDGAVGQAYRQWLPGWGPAFSTKFMFAVAAAIDLPRHPRALILDARVWKTLATGEWSSLKEAGSRLWTERYVGYVRAMHRWAEVMDVRADSVERLLFELAGAETTA